MTNYYDKTTTDAKYARVGDVYTTVESDNKYALISNVYSRTASDTKYALISDVYTKTVSDTKYALLSDVYNKTTSDNKYALISGVYDKTASDGKYQLKLTATLPLAISTDNILSIELSTYATQTYVDTAVANIVNAAPPLLNTLNELAAALGNDPNFSTSIATLIAAKAPTNLPDIYGNRSRNHGIHGRTGEREQYKRSEQTHLDRRPDRVKYVPAADNVNDGRVCEERHRGWDALGDRIDYCALPVRSHDSTIVLPADFGDVRLPDLDNSHVHLPG